MATLSKAYTNKFIKVMKNKNTVSVGSYSPMSYMQEVEPLFCSWKQRPSLAMKPRFWKERVDQK